MPTGVKDTHSRTRASQEPIHHSSNQSHRRGKGSYPRRSSGLRVHFVDVEVFSLLPQCQRNGCNLACQRESYHGRLDAFGERALVELLKRSGLHAGPNGGGFKQAFEIMVVILVQAPNPYWFLALHLAFYKVIFPTVASLQPQ